MADAAKKAADPTKSILKMVVAAYSLARRARLNVSEPKLGHPKRANAMIREWDVDENGDIIVYPLFGYNTAMIAAMTLLIRFDCARCEEDLERGTTHRFQMTMTTAQCRMFAQDLLRSADLVETQGPYARH